MRRRIRLGVILATVFMLSTSLLVAAEKKPKKKKPAPAASPTAQPGPADSDELKQASRSGTKAISTRRSPRSARSSRSSRPNRSPC